jgi:hypothetical protein
VARIQDLAGRAPEPVVMAVLGYARARTGDQARARECLAWLNRTARSHYVPAELFALVHVGMGDKDAAIRWLNEAKARRSNGMTYLSVEPALDPLRSDPRFVALVREVARGESPTAPVR